MEEGKTFTITEAEVNKILSYISSRPLAEVLELYTMLMILGQNPNDEGKKGKSSK